MKCIFTSASTTISKSRKAKRIQVQKIQENPNPGKLRIRILKNQESRSKKNQDPNPKEKPKNPRSLTLKNPDPLSFRKSIPPGTCRKTYQIIVLPNPGGFLFYIGLSSPLIISKYFSGIFYRKKYRFS